MSTSSPPTDASAELAALFADFGPAFMRYMRSGLKEREITYARIRLLGALHCSASAHKMSQLSDELGTSPRNITALVDGLEAEGLVARRPHPSDRRATLIELTEAGRSICRKRWDEHQAHGAELFADLSPDDQQHLLRIMGLLRGAIDQHCGDC